MAKPEALYRRSVAIRWMVCWGILILIGTVSAERLWKDTKEHIASSSSVDQHHKSGFTTKLYHLLWNGKSTYQPIWPEMKFGWRIVLGSIIGLLGAALGSMGGVGGGGIFVPMLALIIGFDPKSATAISKCMIMGAAGSTVYYNLRQKHPTRDIPIIDYDLALLFQPMLMLGISIGVTFNVMFADWMVTILLIILFMATSMKAMFKGVETWKNESLMKEAFEEAPKLKETVIQPEEKLEEEYKPLLSGPAATVSAAAPDVTVSILTNIYWKELSLLLFVWVAFLIIQIIKTYTSACSTYYWILYAVQVPIAVWVTLYEAVCLYKGTKVLASKGKETTEWKADQLFLYSLCGMLAGIVGGLLGLGGGFILGPLFLELGVPPQVASATSTFAMMFSSSMSVVQYYILNRFPIPYAMYFILIATFSAIVGQHVVRKIIALIGRASIIIFILSSTILISSISLGGVGIANMVVKMKNNEYIGFDDFCMG